MIGWLEGTVRKRDPQTGEVIVDVQGVGYAVLVSLQCLAAVPPEGGACQLWVHTEMREHQIALFGFSSPEAKRLFNLLTTVPKVGPKLALATLGGFALPELLSAIAGGDAKALQKISGVGKRSAEQMVLTLQDRIAKSFPDTSLDAQTPVAQPEPSSGSKAQDAQAMLVALGWKPKAVEQTLAQLAKELPEELELDEWVRRALARLMD